MDKQDKYKKQKDKIKLQSQIKNIDIELNTKVKEINMDIKEAINNDDRVKAVELKNQKNEAIKNASEQASILKHQYRKKYPAPKFQIFFAIILAVTFLGFITNFCIQLKKSGQFSDYSDFEVYQLSSMNFFNSSRNGSTYWIYIYSESCSSCSRIKYDIFGYINGDSGYPLYLYDTQNAKGKKINAGDKLACQGATSFDQLTIAATPTLLKIVDGSVTYQTSGTTNVLSALNIS